ncbi:unnamed protein product [Penicillium salamii]|nr:unnamed protein product [Penicillium salamii]
MIGIISRIPSPVFLFAVLIIVLTYTTADMFIPNPFTRNPTWKRIAAEKRSAIMAKIPSEWILDTKVIEDARSRQSIAGDFFNDLLDAKTLSITALDVPELVQSMGNGSLTAVEVVNAFSKRAAYAHQLGNFLLEIGFEQAIERARQLDIHFKEHGELVGPLHGVPVTLKDQFHIKGLETSMAYVGWIGTFEGERGTGKEKIVESELIRELGLLGAIPIAKAPETNNNIVGYAWNPHNQKLSTGGSSGGEGAIQALRGSAFGIGTDIGGSVSMPASFQGIFSIKPSSGRISFKGAANTVGRISNCHTDLITDVKFMIKGRGQEVMPTVVGIMGHSVEALCLVFKSLLSTKPWLHDPYVLPVPWREEMQYNASKEIDYTPSFGFISDDGLVTPHPPIARALRMVKKAMEDDGYQLINWEGPSTNNSIQIHGPIARGDGCIDVYEDVQISGEPFVPQIQNLFPRGKPKSPISLPEFERTVRQMKNYRENYLEYWMSTAKITGDKPVEAIISPVTPYASIAPGKFYHSAYISSVNVLDYATIVIPVTTADMKIDVVNPGFRPLTEKDSMNMKSYDPKVHHGAPASIQVIGQKMEEERLLSMAKLIVVALEKYKAKHGDKA